MTGALPLHERSAGDLAAAVRARDITARDLLDHHLERIDRLNPAINAFVFIDAVRARSVADDIDRRIAAGDPVGPLAGVPLGVKELEMVEGWPHTRASTAFRDRIASRTSTMTARLLAAGAVPVGLTAAPEQGLLFHTTSILHGTSRNPWALDRTPGGSSGGAAAALVAGLVPLATGSDSGGSIRLPSAFCGCVGVKGTFGRVSRAPNYIGAADFTHYGPLARCVVDAARYLDVVCGADERDPTSLPAPRPGFTEAIEQLDLRGRRVGFVADNGIAPCDPSVVGVVRQAADALLGAADLHELSPFRLDLPDPTQHGGAPALYMLDTNPAEAAASAEALANLLETKGAGPVIEAAFGHLDLSLPALQGAIAARNVLYERLAVAFDEVDLLLMPTAPVVAFGAEGPVPTSVGGREIGSHAAVTYTSPFNLSGHPAVSVPAGLVDGLPVGLQIVARRHEDTLALAAAAVLERVRPWPTLAPYAR